MDDGEVGVCGWEEVKGDLGGENGAWEGSLEEGGEERLESSESW